MIPEAREVRLKSKMRKVLEAALPGTDIRKCTCLPHGHIADRRRIKNARQRLAPKRIDLLRLAADHVPSLNKRKPCPRDVGWPETEQTQGSRLCRVLG